MNTRKRALNDLVKFVLIFIMIFLAVAIIRYFVKDDIEPLNEDMGYIEQTGHLQYQIQTPEPVIDTTMLLRSLLMQRIRPDNKWDSILIFTMVYADRDWKPSFIIALMYNESRFDPQATGLMGERGLCQVMLSTARYYGFYNYDRLYELEYNILVATTVLKDYLAYYKTKIKAMQGYTGGNRSFAMYYMALMESRTREHLWIKQMDKDLYYDD